MRVPEPPQRLGGLPPDSLVLVFELPEIMGEFCKVLFIGFPGLLRFFSLMFQ